MIYKNGNEKGEEYYQASYYVKKEILKRDLKW